MEDIPNNQDSSKQQTDAAREAANEDFVRQIQAAEDFEFGEGQEDFSDGGFEEEEEEDLSPEEQSIYDAITTSNSKMYIAQAINYQFSKKYDKSCMVLKLILRKLGEAYQDELHIDLATVYYMMGDILLQKIEDSSEVFAGGADTKEDGTEEGFEETAGNVQFDEDDIEAAYENLDVARMIIQKRVDCSSCGDEEKNKLTKQLALIHSRIGSCYTCRDNFKVAVDEYLIALGLQEKVLDPERSRDIAQTLFILGQTINYMTTEQQQANGWSALTYFQRAAVVFENLIIEAYEKSGAPVPPFKHNIKKELAIECDGDSDLINDLKALLKQIYIRINDCFTENEVRKLIEEENKKRKEAEEKKKANPEQVSLNAFGQPIDPSKPVKKLGVFKSKGKVEDESQAQTPNQTNQSALRKRDKSEGDEEGSPQDTVKKHTSL